jgi:4'-phosphopantetheinyl transferase
MQPATPPTARIAWPTPPADLRLGEAEAHVWAFALDLPTESLSRLAPILSAAERERALRFRFELHRNRFVVGRAAMRLLLARYLQAQPTALEFSYGPQGKPALGGTFANAGWHFNLAHSENLALLAMTRTGPIGVDVEYLQPLPDADQLVARFFSARECAAYQKLPVSERTVAFFNLWTRKEAWLKATGEGIGYLLNQVEVSFLPGEPAQLLHLPKLPRSEATGLQNLGTASWSLHALRPATGFAAALALSAPVSRLDCWRWDDQTLNRPSDFSPRIPSA